MEEAATKSPLERAVEDLASDMGELRKMMLTLARGNSSASPPSTPMHAERDSIPPFTERFSSEGAARRTSVGLDRRHTVLEELLDEKTLARPTVVLEKKPFAGSRLEDLELPNVLRFCEEVNKYETGEGHKVQIGTLFTDEAKRKLIAKSAGRLGRATFWSASSKEVISELQRALRPANALAFYDDLERGVKFTPPKGYELSATALDAFYDSLCEYADEFLFVYRFLGQDNEANLPPVNNKEGGLIKLFCSKIPYKYGNSIINTLKKTTYDTLEEFLRDFQKRTEAHRDASVTMREVMRFFRSHPRKEEQIASGRPFRQPYSGNFGQHRRDGAKVMAVAPLNEDDIHSVSSSVSDGSTKEVRAVQPGPTKAKVDRSKMGCYQMLLHGECSVPNCAFNHERSVLEQAHKQLADKLRNSKFNTSGVLFAADPASLTEEDHFYELREHLLAVVPETAVKQAVHRDGVVCVDDARIELCKSEILFDTGADGSYVSEKFFNAHSNLLQHKVIEVRKTIKVANGHEVKLTKAVDMQIVFKSVDGVDHCLRSVFCILPGLAVSVIVGLPDIVQQVSAIFKDMLESAIQSQEYFEAAPTCFTCSSCINPWSTDPAEIAPEEEATPDPCAFTEALRFMEMTVDQAREEFVLQIDSHVSPEFLQTTAVRDLLLGIGMKVFVPSNWEGIKNIPPLEFVWAPNTPTLLKPKARHISPKLFEHARAEFNRLRNYFYRPSDSPVASCLVIAPKTTKPFIRFCGDYVHINRYVERGHFPVPVVKHELAKIIKFPIYIDIDLANAYHQVPLGPITSKRLSVQTPWGQVEPMFMPEGVSPASGVLQSIMHKIFSDFDEWSIVIFDNLLLLAESYEDAYNKLNEVLKRCVEYNIVLKFSKSFLGYRKVSFFGFDCTHKCFELSEKRKLEIAAMEMPKTLKEMQRFLGTAGFFGSFVPSFATLAAPLTDMTKKNFSWDRTTWQLDYENCFNEFKSALTKACAIYYPDYELTWILRTDASQTGVGAVLFQVAMVEGIESLQPIGFTSKKFSAVAQRWSTFEQEGYATYYGVKQFEFYLRGKEFIIETDHRNLQWMEASLVPKVLRWRVYLQSFTFLIRSIPGKLNSVADWQSRIYEVNAVTEVLNLSAEELTMVQQVHGGRAGHHGLERTWGMLKEHFPNHPVRKDALAKFIQCCPICQKNRLPVTNATRVPVVVRHLKVPSERHMVGVDTLSVTPTDKYGNRYLIVIVNFFTRFVAVYPTPHRDAETLASSLLQFFTNFGTFDYVRSDPGSELMSKTVQQLQKWIGVTHNVSLVDRPESNGVEPVNRGILRHLRALVYDERVLHQWSHPAVLAWVTYMLNSFVHSETGVSPYEATFGPYEARYFKWADNLSDSEGYNEYMTHLQKTLSVVRARSKAFQNRLVAERLSANGPHTTLSSGSFVFVKRDKFESKLQPRFEGPFEVLSQFKNDVELRNLVRGDVFKTHVENLKIFFGSREEAVELAILDNDEYQIDEFLAYRGEPNKRTSIEFLVRFSDGDEVWLPWSRDLFTTKQYEAFCRINTELRPLLVSEKQAQKDRQLLVNSDVTEVKEGDVVFVDLRTYGSDWYNTLLLPDKDRLKYMLEYRYLGIHKSRKLIQCYCPLFQEYFWVDNDFIMRYGNIRSLPPRAILLDQQWVDKYPALKPTATDRVQLVLGIARVDLSSYIY